MADFNSRYTGAEIEAAVARTLNIKGLSQVWAGTATNAGIALSSLPVNPDTGDRTGTYDVIMTKDSTPIETNTEHTYTSRFTIINEGARILGNSHTRFMSDEGASHTALYFGESTKLIIGREDRIRWSDSHQTENPLYIHRIYREQSV